MNNDFDDQSGNKFKAFAVLLLAALAILILTFLFYY